MNPIVFDIETGPLPTADVLAVSPPFDAGAVRVGNLGPDKAAAKVESARNEHVAKVLDRAALSALTGRVLAIGYGHNGAVSIDGDGRSERQILLRFWERCRKQMRSDSLMVGHNIFGFDLPFLVRRSWAIGLADKVPARLLRNERYWASIFVDTMIHWRLGDYREYVSLDTLAKAFGLEGKLPGVNGADFARLWEEDPPKALAYLRQDIEVTTNVARRMGILQ